MWIGRVLGRVVLIASVVSGALTAVEVVPAGADVPTGSVTFSHSGAAQAWTVPEGVTSVAVDVFGAQGGHPLYGGPGGRVEATLAVSPGEVLQVNVGGQGTGTAGGFNGGGSGSNGSFGGGGGSDIRRAGSALADRVVVAGGGGGAGDAATSTFGPGGAGGGPDGTAGQVGSGCAAPGLGGSVSAGGAGGVGTRATGGSGSLGVGGNGAYPTYDPGGGGGGGFYGGGAGGVCNGIGPGGGGGSSWAATTATGVGFTQGARLGHGLVKVSWPPAPPAPVTPPTGSATFSYSGNSEWFTVPDGVYAVAVDLAGGQGGNAVYGGPGGRVRATLPVTPGEVFQVNVGGQGTASGGGFNGGGAGSGGSYGGGGASDLRRHGATVADRVVVAAGGGGAGEAATPLSGPGGSGGGVGGRNGQGGACGAPGVGATATGGGAGGVGNRASGGTGSLGLGGNGGYPTYAAGGGGGAGYYGGGAGGVCDYVGGGGAGGASWTVPAAVNVRHDGGVHLGAGSVTLSWPPVTPAPSSPAPGSTTYSFTGAPQWFTVPDGVYGVAVDVYGAQGGNGGYGGRAQATLAVTPGELLLVTVGSQGTTSTGGFNGGGGASGGSWGGGGASDIRQGGATVADRVVVAGGGGGAGENASTSGGGGGLSGGAGTSGACGGAGGGGTQTAGGAGGVGDRGTGGAGGLGQGAGGGYPVYQAGGGGGGGFYGGGAGGVCRSSFGPGGGGGSGYVNGAVALDASLASSVRAGNGTATISWPVPRDASRAFGNDSYGEFVNGVHLGSGNLVESVTDVSVATAGPDLAVARTYNSLDSSVGLFGAGWSSGYETRADANVVTGDVTVVYGDGRRETHVRNPDGSFTAPASFVSTLTAEAAGWSLRHKDDSVDTFDTAGRLVGVADRYGRSLTLAYSAGVLVSVTDPASGRWLALTYAGGRVASVSTSSVSGPGYGGPLTWTYQYSGDLLTKVCDPRDNDPVTGLCTAYGYTAGRLTSISRPDASTALAVSYDGAGKVAWTENGTGDRVTYSYWDGVSVVTDARGSATHYFFDPLWRTTMMIDPTGGITAYGYDGAGFRSRVTDPNGNSSTLAYDARGNLTGQTNAEGETTWFAYDADDNLVARRDGRSANGADNTYRTSFTYNGAGDKLTEVSPATAEQPAGVTQSWTYTTGTEDFGWGTVPAGLVRTTNPGAGNDTAFEYDAGGDLRRRTDPSGLVTTFDHDALGRVTSTTTTWATGSATTTQTLDQLGHPVTVTEPAVVNSAASPPVTHQRQTTNDYDDNGQLWRTTVADVGGSGSPTPTRVTTMAIDAAGRVWKTTDPEGGEVTRTFDGNGNVATVTDPSGRTLATAYDPANRPVSVTLVGFVDDPIAGSTPRDVVLGRTAYDAAGRTTHEYSPAPGTGGRAGQLSPSGTPMIERVTAYDRADRMLSVTHLGFHDRTGATRDIVLEARTYDDAGNVLTATTGGGLRQVTTGYDEASRAQTATLELGVTDRVTDVDYSPTGLPTRRRVTQGASVVETRTHYDAALRPDEVTTENGADDLVVTVGYDQRGLPVWSVDPRGNAPGATAADYRTDRTFDLLGRLVTEQAPEVPIETTGGTPVPGRPTTTTGYDAVGNVETIVDARGFRTATTYDRLDRRTRIDHPAYTPPGGTPLTPFETFSYDAVGNLTASRDRRGQTSDYLFDGRNRVVRRLDPQVTGQPGRGAWLTVYDDAGHTTATADPTGAVTTATHDDLGRPRTSTEVVRQGAGGSFTTTFDHDDLGQRTYTQDPAGVSTTSTYNPAGELLTVTDAAGKVTRYGYDAAGRPTTSEDPLGRVTEHVYDPAGRETETRARNGAAGPILATTWQGYDPAGNTTEARSARSSSATDSTYLSTFTFDPAGRLTQTTQPDGAGPITTSYGYDATGNLTRVTDGNGHATVYTYNPWGLTETTVEPATPGQTTLADRSYTVAYDDAGLPVRHDQPGGVSISRTFDELGRLITETGTGTGVATATRTFGYDLAGRRTTTGHPDGPVTYGYDDRGLLLTASEPGTTTPQAAFGYDPAGRMTTRADTAGTTSFTYTNRGELDTAADPLTGTTTNWDWNDAGQLAAVNSTTTTPAGRALAYDTQGRLDTDTLTAGGAQVWKTDYDYDPDGNVTGQSIDAPGNPGAGAHSYTFDRSGRLDTWTGPNSVVTDYDYDPAGNRTTAGATTSTYDARNRLTTQGATTYTWDPRGTLAAIDDGTVTPVDFDALGRQTAWGTTTYAYDDLDRIATRDTATFTYAGTEIDPVTAGAETYARTPAGELLALQNPAGAHLVGENRHGDLAWLLDPDGTVTDTTIYDPYGQTAGATGATNPSVGYQGDYTDPTTGDVWMGARWYQPNTATFTNRDTIFGMLKTPVTLNRYTYANGDPLQYFDPDGRFSISTLTKAASSAWNKTGGKLVSLVNDKVVEPVAKHATVEAGKAVLKTTVRSHPRLARSITIAKQVVGIGKGFGEGAVGTVTGLATLATHPDQLLATAKAMSRVAIGDPKATKKFASGIVAPILDDARNGNYGEAIGRLSFEAVSAFYGAKGAGKIEGAATAIRRSRAAKTLNTTEKLDEATAVVSAPRTTSVVDDLAGAACSFSGATAVVMADGTTKAISKVKVGDYVLAEDPETGERGSRKVTHLWEHQDVVVDLEIDGDLVTTTEDHPFWNATDREWQEAQNLDVGDLVRTVDGELIPVGGLKLRSARTTTAFNLTVDGIHTYFVAVGEDEVLVHNTCPITPTRHSVNQKINRGVSTADELDAYRNPLQVRDVVYDELGRPSQRYVGRQAEVVLNPETGGIVSVNPTSTSKLQRLLRQLGLEN